MRQSCLSHIWTSFLCCFFVFLPSSALALVHLKGRVLGKWLEAMVLANLEDLQPLAYFKASSLGRSSQWLRSSVWESLISVLDFLQNFQNRGLAL